MSGIRVRFAPSPTGPLHIGGLRTALYNYLFAKRNKGSMILRIEDTDQTRLVPGAEEYIKESLHWIGIEPDESPENPGEFGPYRQSERMAIYSKYAWGLVENGHAYLAFDSPVELNEMRERLKNQGADNQNYGHSSRSLMRNSLTLPPNEIENLKKAGNFVIRIKVDPDQIISFEDHVRGKIQVNSSQLDDKVILKSDGMPTYHLANVVDDYLMKISHVIRGEEWLPSTPLHILLYNKLGWGKNIPQMAHLPLLLKPSGKGKLSKRDADKQGFPIFPLDWKDPETNKLSIGYKGQGYLPNAFLNFLTFLGWNPGTEQEIYSLEELIKIFDLSNVHKSGAKFNIDKAIWFNQQYLKHASDLELAEEIVKNINSDDRKIKLEKAIMIANLMKGRIDFVKDLWQNNCYLYHNPEAYDEKVTRKKWGPEAKLIAQEFANALENSDQFDENIANNLLESTLENNNISLSKVLQAIRLAITGVGWGPDLMKVMSIIGKEETVKRLRIAARTLP